MMGGYFKQLTNRSGMLEADSATRRATADSHRKVVEFNKKTVAPLHSSERASSSMIGVPPAKAGTIVTDVTGVTDSVDKTNPELATTYPTQPYMLPSSKFEEPSQYSISNSSFYRKGAWGADSVPERLDADCTETVQQPATTGQVVERTEYNNTDNLNAEGQSANISPILDIAIVPDLGTGNGLVDTAILSSPDSLFPDRSGRENLDDSSPGTNKELKALIVPQASSPHITTKDYMSIRRVSKTEPGYSGLTMSASNVQGASRVSSMPMPDRAPQVTSKQNVEVRIGSVTMEVHQKQPTLVMNPQQARQTGGSQFNSLGQSSGFRPSRYYLRGL